MGLVGNQFWPARFLVLHTKQINWTYCVIMLLTSHMNHLSIHQAISHWPSNNQTLLFQVFGSLHCAHGTSTDKSYICSLCLVDEFAAFKTKHRCGTWLSVYLRPSMPPSPTLPQHGYIRGPGFTLLEYWYKTTFSWRVISFYQEMVLNHL